VNRIDYRHVFREVYVPPRDVVARVVVPPRRCLAIDGEGPLDTKAFRAAVAALRALDKALRRRLKRGPMALDFSSMPLEVQRHAARNWTVLLFQPPVVDAALVTSEQAAMADITVARLELRPLPEVPALQTLHAAAMDTVDDALQRLAAFAAGHGLHLAAGHTTIDLGDPRKPPFSCNKTLVRRDLA